MNNKYINKIDIFINSIFIYFKTLINNSKKEHILNNKYVYYLWKYVFYWLYIYIHLGVFILIYIKIKGYYYSEKNILLIKFIILNNYICITLVIYLFIIMIVFYYMTKRIASVIVYTEDKDKTLFILIYTLIKIIMYSIFIFFLFKILDFLDNKIDVLNFIFFEIHGIYKIEQIQEYLNMLLKNSKIITKLDDISLKYLLENTNNYTELKLKFERLEKEKFEELEQLLKEKNKPLPPGIFDKYRNKYTMIVGIVILILLEINYNR